MCTARGVLLRGVSLHPGSGPPRASRSLKSPGSLPPWGNCNWPLRSSGIRDVSQKMSRIDAAGHEGAKGVVSNTCRKQQHHRGDSRCHEDRRTFHKNGCGDFWCSGRSGYLEIVLCERHVTCKHPLRHRHIGKTIGLTIQECGESGCCDRDVGSDFTSFNFFVVQSLPAHHHFDAGLL